MSRSDMVEGPAAVGQAPPPLSSAERSPSPPLRGREERSYAARSAISFFVSAIALAGLSPLGQTLAQFMMV
jgi:hypothetical protein